jgi:hypothetical protein
MLYFRLSKKTVLKYGSKYMYKQCRVTKGHPYAEMWIKQVQI